MLLGLVVICAGLWYFLDGRKPYVALSKPLKEAGERRLCQLGAHQLLLVLGTEATLVDSHASKEIWTINLATSSLPPKPAATPPVPPVPKPAATPAPKPSTPKVLTTDEQIIDARLKREFERLKAVNTTLKQKQVGLKTAL